MSNSEPRQKMVNPLLVKAGIPAAISIAAYICSRIISKRSNSSLSSIPSSMINSRQNIHIVQRDENAGLQLLGHNGRNLEDKLLEQEIHIEGLQQRERDLKRRLLRYQAMKEKEFMLMELRNKMMLEKTRAEFLLKEISLVQDESKRMGGLILEYMKLVHKLKIVRRKIARQRLKVIREQKLKIEARDEELLSNQEEIPKKDELIQELEDEISQMKEAIDHLQREKIETSNNLDNVEKPYSLDPKNEEVVTKEDHDKVVKELEQLQKGREAEVNELTYLRWSNACLRQELSRCHELKDKEELDQNQLTNNGFELHDHDHDVGVDQHSELDTFCEFNYNTTLSAHHPTRGRRRRFIEKVKKWVEGGKVMDDKDKDNHEVKSCFGKNNHVSKESEDLFVHGRISCSSV
ncbi:Protein CHUP1 chloroplastic [Bienertia sinuspersici]